MKEPRRQASIRRERCRENSDKYTKLSGDFRSQKNVRKGQGFNAV
jgi:hypothetical protein